MGAERVQSPPLVVLGGSGLVGTALLAHWHDQFELIAPTHAELDVLDQQALAAFLEHTPASVVVNLAAWADVDAAEAEREDTDGPVYRLNVTYPAQLAKLCRQLDKHLVHISTDYVFDGANGHRPYTEQDAAHPLCWYAQTKFDGEHAVLQSGANVCIARIEMPFTGRSHPKRDLARTISARLREGQPIQGVSDQRITPLLLQDAASALRRLVESRYSGIMHVAASDWTTPFAFACSIAQRLDLPRELIQPVTFDSFASTRPARRPRHSWLDVSQFASVFGPGILRSVDEELDNWAHELRLP